MKIQNILALGGGTMGSQPGFYYAMHGFNVTQFDISEEALAACKAYHRRYVEPFRAAFPSFTDQDIEAGLARISYSSELEVAARDIDFVTESVPEVLEMPQIAERGFLARFEDVPGVDRDIDVVRTGVKLDGEAPAVDASPPELGQDNETIWAELGLSGEEIAALKSKGTI